ncbi:jg4532, partial [Pararge aegeria aegeria]
MLREEENCQAPSLTLRSQVRGDRGCASEEWCGAGNRSAVR